MIVLPNEEMFIMCSFEKDKSKQRFYNMLNVFFYPRRTLFALLPAVHSFTILTHAKQNAIVQEGGIRFHGPRS
jgi:hypothetical protein